MEDVTGATYMTWEELEDCGDIDRKLPKDVIDSSRCHSQSCQSISSTATSGQPQQKSLLTSSTTAATPQVRILKRQPNSDPCLAASNARAATSKPIRTLEEREAAYAEARLRILGSAVAESTTPVSSPQAQVNNIKKSPAVRSPQYGCPETQVCLVNGVGMRR